MLNTKNRRIESYVYFDNSNVLMLVESNGTLKTYQGVSFEEEKVEEHDGKQTKKKIFNSSRYKITIEELKSEYMKVYFVPAV